jgi:hypothetical protein
MNMVLGALIRNIGCELHLPTYRIVLVCRNNCRLLPFYPNCTPCPSSDRYHSSKIHLQPTEQGRQCRSRNRTTGCWPALSDNLVSRIKTSSNSLQLQKYDNTKPKLTIQSAPKLVILNVTFFPVHVSTLNTSAKSAQFSLTIVFVSSDWSFLASLGLCRAGVLLFSRSTQNWLQLPA